MARLSNTEKFVDDEGGEWVFHTAFNDGFIEFFVTAPNAEPRRLRRTKVCYARPSVDTEQPLPLDIK